MKKLFYGLMAMVVAAPVLALAQAAAPVPPESLDQAVGYLPALMAAVKNGNWLLVGAIVTLFITLAIRKFVLPKIGVGSGALPLISAVVGIVAGVGMAIIGGAPLGAAAAAVFSGPLAGTLWDSLVKYFFPKK